ncbi:MAG: enoyl-CoA hydratase [Alphaproteobacteria bacterium]|nr:enoyl-CoA hydratase [Alphaproteobacteria bacterium]
MSEQPVLIDVDARGVATVTLNRPHRNNAYNDAMIQGLLDGVGRLAVDDKVRVIVLRGTGNYFQAGADLKWMNDLSKQSLDANLAMSTITTDAVRHLNACPKPTIALVHGGCFGGGLGMMAACDITIASEETQFSITEVRWGLVAGPILPQLCDAMGLRALRRFALTAEKFSVQTAKEFGFVQEICATGALDEAAAPVIDALLKCSPSAIAETKAFILRTAAHNVDDEAAPGIALAHAMRRRTEEGIEGLASFNERREASWYPGA